MKEKMIVGEREISAPGAIMKVVVLELSPEAKQMLTVRPPMNVLERIKGGEFYAQTTNVFYMQREANLTESRNNFRKALEEEFHAENWNQEIRDKVFSLATAHIEGLMYDNYREIAINYSSLAVLVGMSLVHGKLEMLK